MFNFMMSMFILILDFTHFFLKLFVNVRQVVYTGAVLSGEYTFWQYCWERYISLRGSPEGTTERLQLLRALGKTKDAW